MKPVILLALLAGCTEPTDEPPVSTAPEDTGATGVEHSDTSGDDTHTGPTGDVPDGPSFTCTVVAPANPCAIPEDAHDGVYFLDPDQSGDLGDHPYDPDRNSLFPGGGVSVADLDGDGLLDIVVGNYDATRIYMRQANGQYLDETTTRLPEGLETERSTTTTLADIDNDGDLDMTISRFKRDNLMLLNDGTGVFTDVSERVQIVGDADHFTAGVSFADMDRDGDLDLLLAGYGNFFGSRTSGGDPSYLLRNLGDGTFEDISEQLPDSFQDGFSFMAGWIDVDEDGYPELYNVNDFGNIFPNVLLRNIQGTLTEWFPSNGLDFGIQGMGLEWGDLDGDGDNDLMVAGLRNNRVMLQDDVGLFYDNHLALRLDPDSHNFDNTGQHFTWAPFWGDVNHDMWLDVMHGMGHVYNQNSPENHPDALYLHRPPTGFYDTQAPVPDTASPPYVEVPRHFLDIGPAANVDHMGQTRGLLMADLNDDGWLDLVRQDLIGPMTVQYRECDEGNWLKVKPRQIADAEGHLENHFAVGAEVRVYTSGDVMQKRFITAGSLGIFTSRPHQVHVGLADEEEATRVDVHWPDGTITSCHDVPANHTVEVDYQPAVDQ